MRVLVTGHNGYIGTVLVPLAQRAGHDVVGLDSDLFAPCVFGAAPGRDRVDPQGRPRRRGLGPRGLRRRAAPRRGLQRPGRQPQPADDVRHQPARLRAARREGQAGRRLALRLLLLVQPVRQGSRAPTRSTRAPASRRRRPTASPRCSPSRTSRRWRTTTSAPRTCATRPRTASRRACASTSWSTTSSAGRIRPARSCSRATARRGARSCTSRTSRAPPWPCSTRRASSCTTRRSTSARRDENYTIREVAEIVAEVTGAPASFADGSGEPDTRSYRVDCSKLARVLPARRAAVDRQARRRGARARVRASGA